MSDVSKRDTWGRRKALAHWIKDGEKGTIKDLAVRLGFNERALYEDFECRDRWIGVFVDRDSLHVGVDMIISNYEAFLETVWNLAERYDADGAKSQANIAFKNYREGLQDYSEFLQSIGALPKVATEVFVDQKIERSEVKVNESDGSVLNEAARILNQANRGKDKSGNIHGADGI